MGNQQPKKMNKVTKIQIEVATTKSKFHLELMRDRKNAQIIKTEKQLVARIKSPSRNKLEEVLMAERIVNALKYAQACNYLMSYCASLKPQANFIAENMFNPQKIMPYLGMIYSLIYAAQTLGLSSLKEFKDLMRALNDPQAVMTLVNPEIKDLLSPQPSPAQLNQYFVEMSERNQIPLETINVIGHKFSKNINQKPSNEPTFSEIEKMLADQLKKGFGQGGHGNNMGSQGNQGNNMGGQGGFGGQGGYGGFGGQYGPNGQGWSGNNQNPYNKGFGGNNDHEINPYEAPNYGPNIYTPGKVEPSKNVPPPSQFSQVSSRMSIKDVNDVPFYPDVIKTEPIYKIDPDFNALCQRIKTGL